MGAAVVGAAVGVAVVGAAVVGGGKCDDVGGGGDGAGGGGGVETGGTETALRVRCRTAHASVSSSKTNQLAEGTSVGHLASESPSMYAASDR